MTTGKPTAFISSTIFDLADLRGALRYWLEEGGFEVRASEYTDFEVRPGANSLDACFEAIRSADFYLLLIGDRYGSPFDVTEGISVTREEYRVAYQSFLATGRPVPVLFTRLATKQAVDGWARAGKPEPPPFKDAEAIHAFIAEATREREHGDAVRGRVSPPVANWLYSFRTFKEIIDALKVQLALRPDIPRERLYASILIDLEVTLSVMFKKWQYTPQRDDPTLQPMIAFLAAQGERGEAAIAALTESETDWLTPSHQAYLQKLVEAHALAGNEDIPVVLDRHETVRLSFYLSGGVAPPDQFWTQALRTAATSGALLDYDPETRAFRETPLSLAVTELLREAERYVVLHDAAQPFIASLLINLPRANRMKAPEFELPYDYALALWALYHAQENLYRRVASLYRYLLRERESPMPTALLPTSPLGEDMEERVRRERASRADVRDWDKIAEAWDV